MRSKKRVKRSKKQIYYSTDYVDKDFPTITREDERLADLEEEEAKALQQKLLSTIGDINYNDIVQFGDDEEDVEDFVNIGLSNKNKVEKDNKEDETQDDNESDEDEELGDVSDEEIEDENCIRTDASDYDDYEDVEPKRKVTFAQLEEFKPIAQEPVDMRRPISKEIQKNRGLTPYKKKEYRNPRLKHRKKYQSTMSKRNRIVREVKHETNRYSGESNGINPLSLKSIKL